MHNSQLVEDKIMPKNCYKHFLLFLLLLSAAESIIQIEDVTSIDIFTESTNLAVNMIRRFVSQRTNTLVIVKKCKVNCSLEQKYHTALLSHLLIDLQEDFAIQLFLGRYNDRLWDFNIFIVDSPDAFKTLRYTFPSSQQERFFNFFILLTWEARNDEERNKTLLQIFDTCLSFDVKNVVVMTKSFNVDHISFYTYELFSEGNCRERIEIREINRYEYRNGSLQNDFLFPDHTNNFYGCHLNVTAHMVEPLLSFDGDLKNKTQLMDGSRLGGVEGDILKTIAKSLNFKIRLSFSMEGNKINLIGNSTGCFRDLENRHANFILGGLSSTKPNSSKFTSSYVYHTTPYVFVVRSGLCFGPIKQLIQPLCPTTWAFLLVFFTVSFIFTKTVQTKPELSKLIFGPKITNPICSLFSIFFGNALPVHILPKKCFARVLFAAWLLLSFEVRNGYQGKMFDSLRFSKRIPVPKRIDHLLQQDYTLLTSSYSDFYPTNKTYIVSSTKMRLDILQTSQSRLTATAMLDSLAHYNFINYYTSSLTYVDEAIHTIPCVIFFKKHSIIRPSIDRKIKVLASAGITSHFAKKHVRNGFQNINSHSRFEIKLKNDNLIGVYIISSVMFSISIFVFIIELLAPKSAKLRKIVDVLNSF